MKLKINNKNVGFMNKNVPYFIEYSTHFFTLKMMLKYFLATIRKVAEKGFKIAFMMN